MTKGLTLIQPKDENAREKYIDTFVCPYTNCHTSKYTGYSESNTNPNPNPNHLKRIFTQAIPNCLNNNNKDRNQKPKEQNKKRLLPDEVQQISGLIFFN